MDITVKGLRTRITQHATDRYRDRVHRSTRDVARAQLAAVATAAGEWSDTAPAWVSELEAKRADRWLMLGDDIALPSCDGALVTVLVRGGKTPAEERAANRSRDAKRRQRAARQWRQQRRGRILLA